MQEDINVGSAWVAYGAARLEWIEENVSTEDVVECRYRGSFEEEHYAREILAIVWSELASSGADVSNPYLDQLGIVAEAGYLREYVWHYLQSEEWATLDGLMMEEFLEWVEDNIPEHQVETRAGVEFEGISCSE